MVIIVIIIIVIIIGNINIQNLHIKYNSTLTTYVLLLQYMQGWEFAHMLIAHFLIRSVAQIK